MSKGDAFAYGIAGAITWLAVTAFYGAFGGGILESSFWFYVLNAAMATGAMLVAFCFTARLRRTSRRKRFFPALAFFLPGLIGGLLAVFNLDTLFPELEAVSQGRYAAFLVVGYLALIGLSLEKPAPRAHG
ncbi:hypothetical protein GVN21_12415 [Caulobacter sp. SLTY]|uniref:hypothetical protein n=1 Tax=Caulobacter sp. SLTY TaxID=2683262 RepID=UPI00141317CF|nr:hypothetical protein [Caulobacter sp. SLTY]